MIFVFRLLSFKPTFSLSSFTFIKRLFNSSSLSAIRVVSSAYLRLLIFLPAILIPACASSSPLINVYFCILMYFCKVRERVNRITYIKLETEKCLQCNLPMKTWVTGPERKCVKNVRKDLCERQEKESEVAQSC